MRKRHLWQVDRAAMGRRARRTAVCIVNPGAVGLAVSGSHLRRRDTYVKLFEMTSRPSSKLSSSSKTTTRKTSSSDPIAPQYQPMYCDVCKKQTVHKTSEPDGLRPLGPAQLVWECTQCGTRKD
jgi:hypothetical protein